MYAETWIDRHLRRLLKKVCSFHFGRGSAFVCLWTCSGAGGKNGTVSVPAGFLLLPRIISREKIKEISNKCLVGKHFSIKNDKHQKNLVYLPILCTGFVLPERNIIRSN